jgi:hypothetical protein
MELGLLSGDKLDENDLTIKAGILVAQIVA